MERLARYRESGAEWGDAGLADLALDEVRGLRGCSCARTTSSTPRSPRRCGSTRPGVVAIATACAGDVYTALGAPSTGASPKADGTSRAASASGSDSPARSRPSREIAAGGRADLGRGLAHRVAHRRTGGRRPRRHFDAGRDGLAAVAGPRRPGGLDGRGQGPRRHWRPRRAACRTRLPPSHLTPQLMSQARHEEPSTPPNHRPPADRGPGAMVRRAFAAARRGQPGRAGPGHVHARGGIQRALPVLLGRVSTASARAGTAAASTWSAA